MCVCVCCSVHFAAQNPFGGNGIYGLFCVVVWRSIVYGVNEFGAVVIYWNTQYTNARTHTQQLFLSNIIWRPPKTSVIPFQQLNIYTQWSTLTNKTSYNRRSVARSLKLIKTESAQIFSPHTKTTHRGITIKKTKIHMNTQHLQRHGSQNRTTVICKHPHSTHSHVVMSALALLERC